MYLYNPDETPTDIYATITFTNVSKLLGNHTKLSISSYIDQNTLYRITDSDARDMLKYIAFKVSDFDIKCGVKAIHKSWIFYNNYIQLEFIEKSPKGDKPVIISITYDTKLPCKTTESIIISNIKEFVESLLAVLANRSSVTLSI